MSKTAKIALFISLGLVLGVAILCVVLVLGSLGDREDKSSSAIAVVKVEGTIVAAGDTVSDLKKCLKDPSIKAVILRLDTPGGVVAPVQEMTEIIMKLRDKGKVVVASQGSVSASGGYYLACACDKIVTNPGTITGSIGVILQMPSLEGLAEKVGIGLRVIKSGGMKDSGSPFRTLTPNEEAVLLEMVMDTYDQFLQTVIKSRSAAVRATLATSRGIQETSISDGEVQEFIKSKADGRIFNGAQAVRWGMADQLGSLDDAVKLACQLAGIPETEDNPRGFTHKKSFLAELLGTSPIEDLSSTFTEVSIRFQLQ